MGSGPGKVGIGLDQRKRRGKSRESGRGLIVWGLVVILSALAIVVGNRVAAKHLNLFVEDGSGNYKGTVTKLLDAAPQNPSEDLYLEEIGADSAQIIYFEAQVKAGPHKGERIA
ncbi:MAG: hypothetical protein H6Q61_1226, partial [Firmicutes bacterium]|nr:hypothetical protein [Bacillota bacterium]